MDKKQKRRFPENFREIVIARIKERDEIIQAIKEGRFDEMVNDGRIDKSWSIHPDFKGNYLRMEKVN